MKIAIPEYQGRIAPVFDSCRRILIFIRQDKKVAHVGEEDWSTVSRGRRAGRLKELGVDVLLCGAISCGIEDQICQHGIRLVAWLAGELPSILKAYTEGRVMDPLFAMPGTLLCRHRRQRRRGLKERLEKSHDATMKDKEKKSCQDSTEQDHMEPVREPDGV